MNNANKNKKIKLMIVSGDYPPYKGGISDYTNILFEQLKTKLDENNIFLVTSKFKRSEALARKKVLNIIRKWNIVALFKITDLIKKIKPNTIHIQYPCNYYGRSPLVNLLPFIIKVFFSDIKIIITIHEITNRKLLGKLRLILSSLFSDGIVVVDKSYVSELKKYSLGFIKEDKIIQISVGSNIKIDKEHSLSKREIRSNLSIKNDETVICFFGYIRPNKGIENLLEVFWSLIKNDGYKNLKLIIIGGIYPAYKRKISFYLKNPLLENKIIFQEYADENLVSKIFKIVDFCVLPYDDGLTNKRGSFFACLFHRLPIITTYSKYLPDGLENYKNVMIITPQNKIELKKAMIELINNNSLRNNLSKNITEALKKYSWESIAQYHVDFYHKFQK